MKLGGPPRDYKVKVQTGTESGAGTDSDIDLILTGTEGHISARLNPMIAGNAFENGDQDTVYLNRYLNIGKLREVKVCSNGMGWGSDWSLKWIEIDDRRVYFNQWLDAAVEAAGTASPYFYTIHEPNFETPIPGSTAGSYDYAFHQFWDSEESRLQGLAMFEQTAPAPEGPQPDCIQESFLFESLPLRSPQM